MTIGELWRRAGIDPAAVIQATERLAELVKPAAVWVAETVARVAPVVARVAEAVAPAIVRIGEVARSIPGLMTATTDAERMRAIEAWALSRWPDGLARRLNGADERERLIARMQERGEHEWIALVEKYGFDRIDAAYRVFLRFRDLNHFCAMVLVEAVELAASERTKEGWSAEMAGGFAWIWYSISVPQVARRFRPPDFVEAVGAWRGRSGRRKGSQRGQWETLAALAEGIGYRLDSGTLAIRWSQWKRAGRTSDGIAQRREERRQKRLRPAP